MHRLFAVLAISTAVLAPARGLAAQEQQDLAKQLAHPVASLITPLFPR